MKFPKIHAAKNYTSSLCKCNAMNGTFTILLTHTKSPSLKLQIRYSEQPMKRKMPMKIIRIQLDVL